MKRAVCPRRIKPPLSYTQLIQEALSSRPNGTMILYEIYEYLMNNYEYFRQDDESWKNSVRHALSASSMFRKRPLPRSNGRPKNEWILVGCRLESSEDELSVKAPLVAPLPPTPSTIDRPLKQRVPFLQGSPIATHQWSKRYTGKWPNPDFESKQQINVGVETDGLRLWLPIPRDPLSDYVGLPIISIPHQIIQELCMEANVEHCNDGESTIASNSFTGLGLDDYSLH